MLFAANLFIKNTPFEENHRGLAQTIKGVAGLVDLIAVGVLAGLVISGVASGLIATLGTGGLIGAVSMGVAGVGIVLLDLTTIVHTSYCRRKSDPTSKTDPNNFPPITNDQIEETTPPPLEPPPITNDLSEKTTLPPAIPAGAKGADSESVKPDEFVDSALKIDPSAPSQPARTSSVLREETVALNSEFEESHCESPAEILALPPLDHHQEKPKVNVPPLPRKPDYQQTFVERDQNAQTSNQEIDTYVVPYSNWREDDFISKKSTPKTPEQKIVYQTKMATATPNDLKRIATAQFNEKASPPQPLTSENGHLSSTQEFNLQPSMSARIGQSDGTLANYGDVSIFTHQGRGREVSFVARRGRCYGVFAGIGPKGEEISKASDMLANNLEINMNGDKETCSEAITKSITSAVGLFHRDMLGAHPESHSMTTATCALTLEDAIYLLNVGNSRAILVKKGGKCTQLTEDAVVSNPRFATALTKRGYEKCLDQIDQDYGTARGLGHPHLNRRPKITRITKNTDYSDGDYLLIATAGVWNVATNLEVADYVNDMDLQKKSPQEMAEAIAISAKRARQDYPNIIGIQVLKL